MGAGSVTDPNPENQNGPPNETITRMALSWGEKCVLPIGSVARSLIPSMTYVASELGMGINRAKRRMAETPPKGAIDPHPCDYDTKSFDAHQRAKFWTAFAGRSPPYTT